MPQCHHSGIYLIDKSRTNRRRNKIISAAPLTTLSLGTRSKREQSVLKHIKRRGKAVWVFFRQRSEPAPASVVVLDTVRAGVHCCVSKVLRGVTVLYVLLVVILFADGSRHAAATVYDTPKACQDAAQQAGADLDGDDTGKSAMVSCLQRSNPTTEQHT